MTSPGPLGIISAIGWTKSQWAFWRQYGVDRFGEPSAPGLGEIQGESAYSFGDKLTKIKMQLAALDLGMAASELLPGSPSVKRAEIAEIGSPPHM